MKVDRYVQYGFGQHRIFYITKKGGDVNPPPEVHCYIPDKNNKSIIVLKYLDTGIYYFEIFFRVLGDHLFVFYENGKRTEILNAVIKDRMT